MLAFCLGLTRFLRFLDCGTSLLPVQRSCSIQQNAVSLSDGLAVRCRRIAPPAINLMLRFFPGPPAAAPVFRFPVLHRTALLLRRTCPRSAADRCSRGGDHVRGRRFRYSEEAIAALQLGLSARQSLRM